jgi:hypothetical protein
MMLLQVTLSETARTLFSVGVGFAGGLISSFGLYYVKTFVRTRRLRQAFYEEVKLPAEELEKAHSEKNIQPLHSTIPTVIYEAESNSIGLLTENEIEDLIAYYNMAMTAEEQLGRLIDLDEEEDQYENLKDNFESETLEKLCEYREDAENSLEENQHESVIKIFLEKLLF